MAAQFKRDPKRFVNAIAGQMAEPDKLLLKNTEYRDAVVHDFQEAYRQGAEGHVGDGPLAMAGRGWEFSLSKIPVPVFLWHGEVDTLVTRNMAEYLARQLPNSNFYLVPEAGHLLTDHGRVIEQMRKALHGAVE